LNQIVIPQNTLVTLCGPAGCGKSTFAAKWFLRTQIVSSDECRALVSDDAENQGVSPEAFDLMYFIIRKRLLIRRLTVADATNLKAEDRGRLISIARRFRFNSAVIIFNISLETCLARNASRDRVVPEDAVRDQYQLLEKTLSSIESEDFDHIFIVNESDQSRTKIVIDRPARRFFARRPQKDNSL
jgi:protein phosphatase